MTRLAVLTLALLFAAGLNASADPVPPSGIGDETVFAVAVSPAYSQTGLVVVMAHAFSGKDNSPHLWISHDGGASWQRAAGVGWDGDVPAVAVDSRGHETIFASSNKAFVRSDDYGASFQAVGAPGSIPAPRPDYASSGAVAVPASPDYIWRNGASAPVSGSGGAFTDYQFTYSPTFPATGSHAAALLSVIDKQGMPQVERCDAALTCGSAVPIPGAVTFSAPVHLLPSSAFADDGVVFAQTGRGDYKSSDGGVSFTPLAVAPSNGAAATTTPMMALAPGYQERGPVRTVYAAIFQAFSGTDPHSAGGVYRSDDGGTTWHSVGSPSPLDGGAVAIASAPDGRLFAGYLVSGQQQQGAGLLCSTDQGASWQPTCPKVGSWAPPAGTVGTSTGTGTRCGTGKCPGVSGPVAAGGGSLAGAGSAANKASANVAGAGSRGGATARAPALPVGQVAVAILLLAAIAAGGVFLRRRLS